MKFRHALVAILFPFFLLHTNLSAQDAESCGVCHRKLHQQWLQSPHALAWKNPGFQQQMSRFGDAEFCGRCHAPKSIWGSLDMSDAPEDATFLPLLALQREARDDNPQEGVNCGSCHFIGVLWPIGRATEFLGPYHTSEGHRGQMETSFRSFEVCAGCHGLRPEAYRPVALTEAEGFHHESAAAFAFDNTAECSTCHMPRSKAMLVDLHVFDTLEERSVGRHEFVTRDYQKVSGTLKIALISPTKLRVTNAGLGHPLRVSSGSSYEIVLEDLASGKTEVIPFPEAAVLTPGTSQYLGIPFEAGPKIKVTLVRTARGGIAEEIYSDEVSMEP